MNCKPNERAFIIAGEPRENLGRVVTTIALTGMTCKCGGPVWEVEGNVEPAGGELAGLFTLLFGLRPQVADCCLKPIRDPGDDAVDETLILAGKPATPQPEAI